MSIAHKCDICGATVDSLKNAHWSTLEVENCISGGFAKDKMDICNSCRSRLEEFRECLVYGEFKIDKHYYTQVHTVKELIYFVLHGGE